MPKILIITDVDLDSYFDFTMQYWDAKYHTFPNNFIDYDLTPEQEAEIERMNVWANNVSGYDQHHAV